MKIPIERGVLILSLFITFEAINAETTLEFPMDLGGIVGIVQKIIGPYVKGVDVGYQNSRRSINKKSVIEVINDKIIKLRKLLQDNDNNDDKKVDEETTIIEFLPRQEKMRADNEMKPNLFDQSTYKKIRLKINTILDKQSVPISNKTYILQVFDDLIKQALKSQCQWKSVPNFAPARFRAKKGKKEYTAAELQDNWKKQWELLKETYFNELKVQEAPVTVKDLISVFENFNIFFSHTIKDINEITTRYEISCQIVDKSNRSLQHTIHGKDFKNIERSFSHEENRVCKRFKVCSIELREFLLDFHKSLNDTTVSALKTYAEMYARDANTDGSIEGLNVTNSINNTAIRFGKRVTSTFVKELADFTLDENKDTNKNIKLMNGFLKSVTNRLKMKIKQKLGKVLSSIRVKLREDILIDLDNNLNVELGNLEKETADKLCSMFETCNSDYASRRAMSFGDNIDRNGIDPSTIYVKLGVDLSPLDFGFLSKIGPSFRTNEISKDEYDSTAYNRYRRNYNPTTVKRFSYPPITRTTTLKQETRKTPDIDYIKHKTEVEEIVHKNRSVLIMDNQEDAEVNEIKSD